MIPKDPMILLSFVNLKLRDFYSSLDDMCELEKKLGNIDYTYDKGCNQFV